jgi:SRSO17 transposase
MKCSASGVYAKPVKAMYSASIPIIGLHHGASRNGFVGTAEEIAKTQRRSDWRRLSAAAGTKGPRLHDWCYLELADLEGEESNHHSQVLWTRGLLIRRNIANGDLAYFTTCCPAGTLIKTLVSVEGHRWAIEDSFETAKNEFGLDHNEFRSAGIVTSRSSCSPLP